MAGFPALRLNKELAESGISSVLEEVTIVEKMQVGRQGATGICTDDTFTLLRGDTGAIYYDSRNLGLSINGVVEVTGDAEVAALIEGLPLNEIDIDNLPVPPP